MTDETGLAAALAQDAHGNRTHLRGHALVLDDADRVAAAALAWVDARLTDPATVEAVAERLSWDGGDMQRWREDAHPDHNRWTWRGDGHGDVMREAYRVQAAAALAVVRELLGGTGGEA